MLLLCRQQQRAPGSCWASLMLTHVWIYLYIYTYIYFTSCQGRNICTSKHVLKRAVGASDEWREVIDAHWPPTLLRFPPPATVCPDSMWALAPYVGPAVAPSGAFRLATCCQTRLWLEKRNKKKPSAVYIVPLTLCHASKRRFSPPPPSSPPWGEMGQGGDAGGAAFY